MLGDKPVPKADYLMYESVKEKMLAKGEPLAAAKTSAAKITNARGRPVPPSHPKARRKPVD
jgi:hypothetical protein